MRTVLAGEAEGVCSAAGGGVTGSSAEIRGEGDSGGIAEEVGVGDSCAAATEAQMATRNAKLIPLVMSSEVETSRTLPKKVSRDSFPAFAQSYYGASDFAPDDKWPRCSSANSHLEKGCRAIRSRAEIPHRPHW